MKKLIKIVSLSLIIISLFIMPAIANTTEIVAGNLKFSDLNETHKAYEGIQKLIKAEYISGYPDGTFKPDGFVTRAELIKLVNMVYSYTQKQDETSFKDVKASDWYYENVLIAQKSGYINGYPDGTFNPNGFVTRQELCKILDKINNFVELPYDKKISDEVSPWADLYVNKVVSNRIMTLGENNSFRATEKATRAEVCDALAKFVVEEPSVTPPSTGGSTGTGDDSMTQKELYETMDTVTRRLEKGVIPNLTSDAQKEIVNEIISNMNEYKTDNSHDYKSAASDAYEKYKKLSEKEQENLKYQIQAQNTTKDLLDLKDFFFPDADIN